MSLIQREDDDVTIDLLELLRLLWSKAILIIAVSVVFGGMAFVGTHVLVTPLYKASVTMYVNNRTTSADAANATTLSASDLQASARLVDTYAAIIKNQAFLGAVAKDMRMEPEKAASLMNAVNIKAVNNTEVFSVSVVDPDPEYAARIANTIVKLAPDRIADIVEGSSVKIINEASVPTSIDSPNYKKNALLGLAFGFILIVAIIVIRELSDTTIKSEADFMQWEYPLLGSIPDLKSTGKSSSGSYGYGSNNK